MGSVSEKQIRRDQLLGRVDYLPLDESQLDEIISVAKKSKQATWGREDILHFLRHECGFCLGACIGPVQELVAYLIALLVEGELDIITITTDPKYRRYGLAEGLLHMAIKYTTIKNVHLEVDQANTPALALYKKMGFEISGIRKRYYENARDGYRMQKEL